MKELKWTDHLGQEFKSQRAMSEHWGINLNTLYRRLRMNYSLKDALELPVKERENKIECYGLVFEGFLSFANYLQAEINTVIDKYNQGETPEEIHDKFVCNVEVDGKLFNRVKELSKYTGISMHTFLLRIKNGLTCEDIIKEEKEIELTSKLTGLEWNLIVNITRKGKSQEYLRKIHCIDYEYEGSRFYTLKSLAIKLGISLNKLSTRVETGG